MNINSNISNNGHQTNKNERSGSEEKRLAAQNPGRQDTPPKIDEVTRQRVIEIPVQHIKTPFSTANTSFPQPPPSTTSGSRLFRENSPFANSHLNHSRLPDNFNSPGFFDNSDFFDRFDKDFGNFCFINFCYNTIKHQTNDDLIMNICVLIYA